METSGKVVVDDRALIGWYQMPAPLQAKALEALGSMAGQSPESWPADEVERWWPDRNLFAYHFMVGPDELLIFFYPEGRRIHIESMMLKETTDRYSTRKA